MKTCKVRLFDGRVVMAKFIGKCRAHKGAYVIKHDDKYYRASNIELDKNYPFWCRFIGPAAVMRAMP